MRNLVITLLSLQYLPILKFSRAVCGSGLKGEQLAFRLREGEPGWERVSFWSRKKKWSLLSAPSGGLENFCCVDWISRVSLLHLFLAFCSTTFPLLYLFWIFVCVLELASFLRHVSPNGNVFGHCSAFALVSHSTYTEIHTWSVVLPLELSWL